MSRQMLVRLAGPVMAGLLWLTLSNLGFEAPAVRVLAAASWMLIWWVFEAVPIGVTSVLPMVIFPLFGVASIAETTAPYGSHFVFLFMGGFLIALALERWQLHKRFALTVLVAAGGRPRRLIGGFMLATAALSMWISNTATTLMMLPIALSVLQKVDEDEYPNFGIALLLATAYAANLGGIATLIGTPPNVAMAGILESQFSIEVPFLEWTLMALPFSLVMLLLVFVLLTRVLTPISNASLRQGVHGIRTELKALGPLSISERRVATVFGFTGMMWVVRRWLASGTGVELNDTTIAMIGGISLFLIPADEKKNRSLLTWNEAKGLPWEILLLFGGGLTLANALNEAGVLTMAADAISSLQGMNGSLLVFVLVAFALLLTEVMSNLALTIVMVPVVGQVAISWGMDPLLLVIPVTMASSCAFMLPMATPPNAIIFGSNKVSMGTMARVGLILNLIAAVLAWIWGLFVLPVWMQLT